MKSIIGKTVFVLALALLSKSVPAAVFKAAGGNPAVPLKGGKIGSGHGF